MRGNIAITIVHHDLEEEEKVKGYNKETFRRTLKYENDVKIDQMTELVAISKFCYQEKM